jgi:predicted PurR-regulated permease PerM
MIPLIINQVKLLVERLPDYIEQISEFAARFGIDFTGENLSEAAGEVGGDLSRFSRDIAGSIFGVGQTLLNTVFQLLTIGLFTFYMTAEGPRLRRAVCSVLPRDKQLEVLRVWDIAIDKTGAYFYTRTLLAGISAGLAWAVFALIGLDFPVALALWMGIISQFVPVIGTYLGGALPLIIALLDSPGKAIAVVGYVVLYQQIENYLLAPKLTARTMSLHPAVSFGSAIAGGTLMGVPGALMALPVAATLQAFISTYIDRYKVVDSPLTEEPPRKAED